MSEPHRIDLQDQQVQDLLWSVLAYISSTETKDLIETAILNQWDLGAARGHVAFQALCLEWHLAPTGHPNPERHALTAIKQSASNEDFALLHPSLQIKSTSPTPSSHD
jgi:hypothetical protein